VAPHPENVDMRVAAIAKSNLVKPGAPAYKFRLDPFVWDGTTQLRAGDLLEHAGEDPDGASDAETFLRNALIEGREDSAALARQAESGYGINRRTLQRTAKRLGVVKESVGFSSGRKVYWSLTTSISDNINDTPINNVVDGSNTVKSALFDASSTISDTRTKAVADGVVHVSPLPAEPIFDVEI